MADLGLVRVLVDPGFVLRGPGIAARRRLFYLVASAMVVILAIASPAIYGAGIQKPGVDLIASFSDPAAMAYPGGKSGSGVYQRIINLMPPHRVYIEPFLGGGALLRLKKPAALNIGVEIDSAVIAGFAGHIAASGDSGRPRQEGRTATSTTIVSGDGITFLESYKFQGDELVYCDPPYLLATRSSGKLYRYELTEVDHQRLLRCIRKIKAMVIVSGYWSQMYASTLKGWNSLHFEAMTRGRLATEWLWFNFPEPNVLHDYRYLGADFRERERIKRKKNRWTARLARMPLLERQALLSAIEDFTAGDGPAGTGVARSHPAGSDVSGSEDPQRAENPVQRETEESPRTI